MPTPTDSTGPFVELPAFPVTMSNSSEPNVQQFTGLTMRDYFAAQAMAALIARDKGQPCEVVSSSAYRYADAMVEFRERYTM